MRKGKALYMIIPVLILLLLLLESPKVTAAAADGIKLCIESLIPSLFPFLFITTVLNNYFMAVNNPILRLLGKACGIPAGAEAIFLLGILGGYPAGAQCISRSYQRGMLSKENARHMSGFCNNAGPAFIFGVGAILFKNKIALLVLWGLQVISAVIVGYLTRVNSPETCKVVPTSQTIHEALMHSVKVMGIICGWVVIFRIIVTFLDFLPAALHTGIIGVLEISNGFFALKHVKNEGIRFIAAAVFLSWGGFCVLMQTAGLLDQMGIRQYLRSKMLQTFLVFSLSYFAQLLLFSPEDRVKLPWIIAILPLVSIILYFRSKIVLAFRKNLVYNGGKVQNTE